MTFDKACRSASRSARQSHSARHVVVDMYRGAIEYEVASDAELDDDGIHFGHRIVATFDEEGRRIGDDT